MAQDRAERIGALRRKGRAQVLVVGGGINGISTFRELALNGIRHGHATRIGVAGCMEDGHLLFSVADNGVGFDLNNHPDVPQGHYGIQGVRERLRQLGGKIEYESEPGSGTRVKVDVPIADE